MFPCSSATAMHVGQKTTILCRDGVIENIRWRHRDVDEIRYCTKVFIELICLSYFLAYHVRPLEDAYRAVTKVICSIRRIILPSYIYIGIMIFHYKNPYEAICTIECQKGFVAVAHLSHTTTTFRSEVVFLLCEYRRESIEPTL